MKLKNNHVNKLCIILIAIFSLLLVFDKFTNNIWEAGQDKNFHLAIIRGYLESFSNGDFLVNIIPEAGLNMGYGSPMLYPTTMHYLTALLSLIIPSNNSIEIACDISFLMNIFLSGVSIFYLSIYLFKNRLVAIISAIIYASYPYHLATLFVRFSFSESWIFVFLPILLLGIFKFLKEEVKIINIFFIIGLVGCMYSHILTTVFIVIILSVLLPIYLFFKDNRTIIRNNIKSLLLSSLIVLLITSPLYINIIYFKTTHNLNVFVDGSMSTNESFINHALTLQDLFYLKPDSYSNSIREHNYLDFSMPLFVMISLVLSLITMLFNDKHKKTLLSLVILMIVVICFICLVYPLNGEFITDKIKLLQFPWRLVNFWALLVALLSPVWLLIIKYNMNKVFSIALLIIMFITNVNNFYYICTDGIACKTSTNNVSITDIPYLTYNDVMNIPDIEIQQLNLGTVNEYVDHNITNDGEVIRQRSNKVITFSDNLVNPQVIVNKVPYLKFSVEGNGEGIIGLPRFYYNDYILTDTEGNHYELFNDQGLLNAKVEANRTYVLDYQENAIITIAKLIRLIGVVALILLLIKVYK